MLCVWGAELSSGSGSVGEVWLKRGANQWQQNQQHWLRGLVQRGGMWASREPTRDSRGERGRGCPDRIIQWE